MKKNFIKSVTPCFKRWARKGWAAFASMRRVVKIGVLPVGMSIVTASFNSAMAQDNPQEVTDTVTLKELEVITQRANPARGNILPSMVYERQSMNKMPIVSLESALKLNPVVDVRERGAMGVQSDISLFGGSSDQTMVMLNGIDFSDARTGHQSHSLPIELDDVSSIKLMSGMQGMGALSGAVNLVTSPIDEQYLRIHVQGGEHGYSSANLSGGMVNGGFSAMLSGSYKKSDGYISNTDFSNYNFFVRSQFAIAGGGFDVQAGYQKKSFGANAFYSLVYPNQWEATETMLGSVKWKRPMGENISISAFVSYRRNSDAFELFRQGCDVPSWYGGANYHLTDNAGAGIGLDYRWAAGCTTVGFNYAYNHIYSNVLGDSMAHPKRVDGTYDAYYTKEAARNVYDVWLKHSLQLSSHWGADVSLTHANSSYGRSLIWSGEVNYKPDKTLSTYLNVARSMRLPTFTDLYYTTATHVGNANLSPEKAVTFRMGAQYAVQRFTVGANLFYRRGSDIIDWVKPDEGDKWESRQITRLNTVGADISVSHTFDGCVNRVMLSYAYLNSDKESRNYISKYALDYMANRASGSIGFVFWRGMNLNLCASYYDRAGSYQNVQGEHCNYPKDWLLDARLSQQLAMFNFYVDVSNLFNVKHYDFGGLEQAGRYCVCGMVVLL